MITLNIEHVESGKFQYVYLRFNISNQMISHDNEICKSDFWKVGFCNVINVIACREKGRKEKRDRQSRPPMKNMSQAKMMSSIEAMCPRDKQDCTPVRERFV